MKSYDFGILSPFEFECFVRDILCERDSIDYSSFAEGRDGGIDLRASYGEGKKIIVQAKRYKTWKELKQELKKEIDKVKRVGIDTVKRVMHDPHVGRFDHYASCKEEAEPNDVSTSLAVKKFLNISNNSSDLNAVKPNQEYNDSYDKFFVADGDDPKTSKFNIPAALAAKTAGGDPHSDTFNNGVNKVKSSDVFKLKPVKDETEETTFKA
mgnify:CR=1 FL=1